MSRRSEGIRSLCPNQAAAFVGATVAAAAEESSDEGHIAAEIAFESEQQALDTDTELMAAVTGITVEAMRRALLFQQSFAAFADLISARYPDPVAGIWVDPAPAVTGHIRFVGSVPQSVVTEAESEGLDIRFYASGGLTLEDRSRQTELLAKGLQESGFEQFETYFDVRVNRHVITLGTHSRRAPFTVQSVSDLVLGYLKTRGPAGGWSPTVAVLDPSLVDISILEGPGPVIDLLHSRGGNRLTDDGSIECTSGWSVTKNGVDGILTAGHCTGLNQFIDPNAAPYSMAFQDQEYYNGSRGDVEWHTTTHIEFAEFYSDATTIGAVTSTRSTATMPGNARRAVLAADRARRHRDLQDLLRPRRGSLCHGGSRSVRQMARRPAHLGRGHPRPPHPTPWSLVAGARLPHLERAEPIRPHQAGLPACGELGNLTSSTMAGFHSSWT